MGFEAGLDAEARGKIFCLCQWSNPGHWVCSQTLYWATPAYQANLSRFRHADAKGERKYSSYPFLPSALYGVSGQRHAPAALYHRGKNPRNPLYRGLGGYILFNNSVRTSNKTLHFTITKTNLLMLFKRTITFYTENQRSTKNKKSAFTDCQRRWYI
jgi:hypothetical protein